MTITHKIIVSQNQDTRSYHRVHGLYFLAGIFAVTTYIIQIVCFMRLIKRTKSKLFLLAYNLTLKCNIELKGGISIVYKRNFTIFNSQMI